MRGPRFFALTSALVLGSTALLVQVSAQPSLAAPSSGWIYYPAGVSLTNATQTIVQGTKDSNGVCNLPGQSGVVSDALVHVQIQTGLNPTTCQFQLLSGTTQATSSSSAQAQSGTTSDQKSFSGRGAAGTPPPSAPGRPSTTSSSASSTVAATSYTSAHAYQQNQWLDPFGVQVNAQEQWINWAWSGSCITNWGFSNKYSWYTGDGWSKRWGHNTYYVSCSGLSSYPDSAFVNSIFCYELTGNRAATYTYFGYSGGTTYGDDLAGFPGGSFYWDTYDSKTGGCTTLLHHGHYVSVGYP